ncbi:MAG: helix-turn-helix transcriptional regulator [bacterium]|nr:helix-turn-helix transcriptional regulator [bacterium]
MTTGSRLREIRKEEKLTLEELSEKFDKLVSAQTLSNYERGERTPDPDFIAQFGEIFNLSGDWLLSGTGPKEKDKTVGRRKKDSPDLFRELRERLKHDAAKGKGNSKPLGFKRGEITSDTTENFLELLTALTLDENTRDQLFKYYYHMLRTEALEQIKNNR